MYERGEGLALLGVLENSDNESFRVMAAEFLARMENAEFLDDLGYCLIDTSELVQMKVAIALCYHGRDQGGVDFFYEWDFDKDLKLEVIPALLALNSAAARSVLEDAMMDSDPEIAEKAHQALLEGRKRAKNLESWEPEKIVGEEEI
ncbi:MAG: hypothetical protein BAJATHORv1_20277 [Candidatus Thorarchaeota archaeon]|nr:MAG: hypothetical protein BAJATHORv1_20277 [Candidatus Thorarchaeota archaeon]